MSEISMDLKARDQMSSVLDHVTQRLGIFNSAGLAMGVSFFAINKGIDLAAQAIQGLVDYVKDGVEANRQFDLSLARLSVSTNNFDISIGALKSDILSFSTMFATDVNVLTEGLKNFTRQGYSASDSLRLLFETGRLQVTTGENLADIQDTVNTLLETFNLDANAAGYVTKKLNEVTSTTGMSIAGLGDIVGASAGEIQNANISIEDMANVIYSLEQRGYRGRRMISAFKDAIKDLNNFKIDILPNDTVVDINTKYKTIADTAQYTKEQVKQLNAQRQMRFGEGADVTPKATVESARALVDARKTGNTVTLYAISLLKQWDFLFQGQISTITDYANAIEEVEYQEQQAAKANADYERTLPFRNAAKQIKAVADNLKTLKSTLADSQTLLAQTVLDLSNLNVDRSFTIQMHDATDAVEKQQAAIEGLRRISNAYSLEQEKNSLEINKIKFNADARHGLDRTQKEIIDSLEKTNAELQIKEQENQIAMMTIQQNGLMTAQDNLERIRQEYDEKMYNREICDLDANIKAKNEIYASTLATIDETNIAISKNQEKWRSNELIKMISWSRSMHTWFNYAYGSSDGSYSNPSETQANKKAEPNPPGYTGRIPFWKYQEGGMVAETAPALLHKGEIVLPSDMVRDMLRNKPRPMPDFMSPITQQQPVSQPAGNPVNHITVTFGDVNITANSGNDVENWGKCLGSGIQNGILSSTGAGTTTVTSRKTGASIVVPGTTMTARTGRAPTATVITSYPITHRGRFRIG